MERLTTNDAEAGQLESVMEHLVALSGSDTAKFRDDLFKFSLL